MEQYLWYWLVECFLIKALAWILYFRRGINWGVNASQMKQKELYGSEWGRNYATTTKSVLKMNFVEKGIWTSNSPLHQIKTFRCRCRSEQCAPFEPYFRNLKGSFITESVATETLQKFPPRKDARKHPFIMFSLPAGNFCLSR